MQTRWQEWGAYSYSLVSGSNSVQTNWLATRANLQRTKIIVIGIAAFSMLMLLQASFTRTSLPSGSSLPSAHLVSSHPQNYSVKGIAYIFPQYYPFPENDKLWGVNFTEWDNVRLVEKNRFGLETVRPHESVGYYNGLNFTTRKRQGEFIKESGLYGFVYHHYWFAGKPVMDHVIQAMLKDGEPNAPFMLSWANEPWTANWDGMDSSKVLIAQDYGNIKDWRKHFDWLLPFFRHPQHIRSEGKVQFAVYRPSHIGSLAEDMYSAFRQWAIDEGLGGMDIIETRWGDQKGTNGPDAVNEFSPHTAGVNHERHHLTFRNARIYHRGTHVCWDTTPRHPHDRTLPLSPLCNPETWKYNIIKMLRWIKRNPNPRGAENFFFINALNEWGEGNVLEPSVQYGFRYRDALQEAFRISDENDVWRDEEIKKSLERMKNFTSLGQVKQLDVCVLVQTGPEHGDDHIFTLDDMLKSLQAQRNQNWKALVFEEHGQWGSLNGEVSRAADPRIIKVSLSDAKDSLGRLGWVIDNLEEVDQDCAAAKYILITNGGNEYQPSAFDTTVNGTADILALNSESLRKLWDEDAFTDGTLNIQDYCGQLEDSTKSLPQRSQENPVSFDDLSTTFLSLPRLCPSGYSFSFYNSTGSGTSQGELLHTLLQKYGWRRAEPPNNEVHVLYNPTYTGCVKNGGIWVDSDTFEEYGCYTTQEMVAKFGANLEAIDLQSFRERGSCARTKVKSGM